MEKLTIREIEKMESNFLSATEAANALGISIVTFYRRAKKLDFPIMRIGKKYAIPREQFLAYLRSERRNRNVRSEK